MLTKGSGAPPGGLQMPFAPNGLMGGFNPNQFGMAGMMPQMQMGGPGANNGQMAGQVPNQMLSGL